MSDVADGTHEVKDDALVVQRREVEGEVVALVTQIVIVAPLITCEGAGSFLTAVDALVDGYVHERLSNDGVAGLGDVGSGYGVHKGGV